jgi:amidase
MATFITPLDSSGDGVRLAVKDLIDVEGVPTTAGCRAVADQASPAAADAPLMAGARAAGARIVGKVNLHELAFGATGINPWFGTPTNPLDPALIPGGSSSGSAVAVASGEADVAYGSDTGGSVRIPSACCGTAGLKTTHGRISLEGVWLLSQSLDTIGPMARDVAGLVLGMQLLEPGFAVASTSPTRIGRFRLPGTDPRIDAAVDRALAEAELEVEDIDLPGWHNGQTATVMVLLGEAYEHGKKVLEMAGGEGVGQDVAENIAMGGAITEEQILEGHVNRNNWLAELTAVLSRVEAIALPTLLVFPPTIEGQAGVDVTAAVLPINGSGLPALALPIPAEGSPLPASLQLVGPSNGEEQLLALGRVVEAAVSR